MQRKSHGGVILLVLVILVLGCGACFAIGTLALVAWRGMGENVGRLMGGAVAVIEVKGVIVSGSGGNSLGAQGRTYAQDVIKDLDKALANPDVKAIVLEVDSPGGSVVASADIYHALQASPKPVVTSMGEVAASGGYYIACATRHIVVRRDTITGSIGVIWQFSNAERLLKALGVEFQIIKSGKHKDEGGLHRPLTAEEMAMYQAIVDEAYGDFVGVVARGRNMAEERVRALADGRIFSGRQALSLGLADSEGNLDKAIEIAAELGGIQGKPRIVRFPKPVNPLQALTGLAARVNRPPELTLLEELLGMGGVPKLQYLYVAP